MSVQRQYFDSEILLKLCYKEITYYTNLERKNIETEELRLVQSKNCYNSAIITGV